MFHSIRSKVLIAIISITAITAIAITFVFYIKSAQMIERNYGENLYARMEQVGVQLDNSLREIYYLTVEASCDKEIVLLINEFKQAKDEGILEKAAVLLRNYCKRYSEIGSVYLVFPEDNIVVTSQDYPIYDKNVKADAIKLTKTLSEHTLTPSIIKDPLRSSSDILSFASSIKSGTGDIIGYVLFNIQERVLYYNYLDGFENGKLAKAIILDNNGIIVSTKNQNEVGKSYQQNDFSIQLPSGIVNNHSNSLLNVLYHTNFSSFHFWVEIEKEVLLRDLRQIRYFLFILLVLFCGLACIIAYIISNAVHKPLMELTKTMEKVSKGELENRVEITTKDEIASLSKDFNIMLDHINDLIEQLLKEERLKKDAELEALQYQITPHFMYNTLNSIKFAALLHGEKELGGLIEDFIELLQASINKKGTFVTIADELHFLENYIHLQKFRYEGNFEVIYEIEPKTNGCFLPRLLLQPLIENAILHGLDMKNENSHILVSIKIENEMLSISVEDNGRGMTEEQIKNLLKKKEKKTNGLSGIGVANVKERLKLYYGEQAGIFFTSGEDGTKACIFLPAYKDSDKYAI